MLHVEGRRGPSVSLEGTLPSSRLFVCACLSIACLGGPVLAQTGVRPAAPDDVPIVGPDTTPPPPANAAPSASVDVSPSGVQPSPPPSKAASAKARRSAKASPPIGGAVAPPPATEAAIAPAPPGPTAAPSVPVPPVLLRAEDCLRANVERVTHLESSSKSAVDFLLSDVCAEEVEAGSLYVRNLEALAHFNPESERGRAGLSTASVDPETGQILNPPNVDVTSALAADAALRTNLVGPAAILRKYAAILVITEKTRPAPTKKSR